MRKSTRPLEELDLSIANMKTRDAEERAGGTLESLRGVEVVRFVGQGAWIAYDADVTSKDVICEALHAAGFAAETFQDSVSGEEGSSKF